MTPNHIACKICGQHTTPVFSKTVLGKYDVVYFKCSACQFIQTEEPYWLSESYQSAITNLDLGLVSRNVVNSRFVATLIQTMFDGKKKFIDYGGGYGMFVRMLRDRGFDYYRQDMYCANIFAKHFDVSDLAPTTRFELLTAFEVFEHLVDPAMELEQMLQYSNNILFSTELQPEGENISNWWYIAPETGQHIAFYTLRSLQVLAERFGLYLLSHGTYHLFTKNKKHSTLFKLATNRKFQILSGFFAQPKTLLDADFDQVRNELNRSFMQQQ